MEDDSQQSPESVDAVTALETRLSNLNEIFDELPNIEARAAVSEEIFATQQELLETIENKQVQDRFDNLFKLIGSRTYTDSAGLEVTESVYYSPELKRAAINIKAQEGSPLGFKERLMFIDENSLPTKK